MPDMAECVPHPRALRRPGRSSGRAGPRVRSGADGLARLLGLAGGRPPIAAVTSYDTHGIRLEPAGPGAKPVTEQWARTGRLPEF